MRLPISKVLVAAAVYNIVWGTSVILFPLWFFELVGWEAPRYPAIWQCVGMIVGVYGVGYAIAATDPDRHWPIVLVGLLGKILGPIGFAFASARESFPVEALAMIVTNDLIWWIPFGAHLWRVARLNASTPAPELAETPEKAIAKARLADGTRFPDWAGDAPVLIVFLRHAGCIFCLEALDDLAKRRAEIQNLGVKILFVHSGTADEGCPVLQSMGWTDNDFIPDPTTELYAAFRLKKGGFWNLFGPQVWLRGTLVWFRGYRVGNLKGDGFQLPGVFIVHRGEVKTEYRHRRASDRPDYVEIVRNYVKINQ